MPIITNTEARLYTVGAVKLLPGANQVPEDAWAAVKDHPLIRIRKGLGLIVEGSATQPQAPVVEADPPAEDPPQGPPSPAPEATGKGSGKGGKTDPPNPPAPAADQP